VVSIPLLVENKDGTFVYKFLKDLLPNDMVVFDGPGAFSNLDAAQHALLDEIRAAGGLAAWRKLGSPRERD
jgi:hypothetical protein